MLAGCAGILGLDEVEGYDADLSFVPPVRDADAPDAADAADSADATDE